MRVARGTRSEIGPEMYRRIGRYRHDVFVKRMGWRMPCPEETESDEFDRDDTVHVAALSPGEKIIGYARMLRTSGPYLLEKLFPQLVDEATRPKRADVWELSRFSAVDLDGPPRRHRHRLSSGTAIKVLDHAIEYAQDHGVRRLITVSPMGVERLLHRAGFRSCRAGNPQQVNGERMFACWIEAARRC